MEKDKLERSRSDAAASGLKKIEALLHQAERQAGLQGDELDDVVARAKSLLAEIESEPDRGLALTLIAEFNVNFLRPAEAVEQLQSAESIFERAGDQRKRAIALASLGSALHNLGKLGEAMQSLRTSLKLSEDIGYRSGMASAYIKIGLLQHLLNDRAAALESMHNALAICEELGIMDAKLRCLNNLALIHQENEDNAAALDYGRQCLNLSRELNVRDSEGLSLINIGATLYRMEEHAEALAHFEEALEILREVGDRKREVIALSNIASVHRVMGENDRGLAIMRESMALAQSTGDRYAEVVGQLGLGTMYNNCGDHQAGLPLLLEGLDDAQKLEFRHLLPLFYKSISESYEGLSQFEEAFDYHQRFHLADREAFDEQSEEKIRNLRVVHQLEQTRKASELHRLETVELSATKDHLERLVRANNEFLGIAAHDLKNPIANIKSLAGLIKRRLPQLSPADTAAYCADIEASALSMLDLVTRLLEINRIDQGRLNITPAAFDVGEMCERFLSVYEDRARKKDIRLHFHAPAEAIIAFADRDVSIQILDNLVSNAVKYSPPSAQVCIEVSGRQDGDEAFARFAVQDEGPGIAEADMPRLFDKFARLAAQPTGGEASVGLGLSITKKLVEAMQGRVWCENQSDRGATFFVELPALASSGIDLQSRNARRSE